MTSTERLDTTLAVEKNLDVALYLEGVRVPFIRAIVRGKVNETATAVIDLIPIASALMIRPRTSVFIFYWDAPFIPKFIPGTNQLTIPQWRLLFEGETTGPGASKGESGTVIQFEAVDHTNYYQQCYQYFVNGEQAYTASAWELAMFTGNNGITGKVIYNQPIKPDLGVVYNTIIRGMDGVDNVSSQDPSVNPWVSTFKTPFTGLLRTMQYVGGSSAGDLVGLVPGVNRFFVDAEHRLKIMQKIFFFQDVKISDFMRTQALNKILEMNPLANEVSSVSDIGTIWGLVQKFLSAGGYDSVPILAPPYGNNPTRDANGGSTPNVSGAPAILSTLWRPRCYFLPPPTCNLIFPNRLNKFRFRQNPLTEPTRLRTKIHLLPGRGTEGYAAQPGEWSYYAPRQVMNSILNAEADSSLDALNGMTDAAPAGSHFASDQDVAKESRSIQRSYGSPFPGAGADTFGDRLISDPSRGIFEAETGIVPMFNTLDSATHQFVTQAGALNTVDTGDLISGIQSGGDLHSRAQYLLGLGDYTLDVARSEKRSLEILTPFNPNLLMGFSGAAVDLTGIYFGEFDEFVHTLSGSSSELSTTQIVASHPRCAPAPPLLSYYSDQQLLGVTNDLGWGVTFNGSGFVPGAVPPGSVFGDPITGIPWSPMIDPRLGTQVYAYLDRDDTNDIPPYLNDLYRPFSIGPAIYAGFGTRSVYGAVGGGFSSQSGACIKLLMEYLRADDKDEWVLENTWRSNITTFDQVHSFYGNPAGRKAAGTKNYPARSEGDLANATENEELFSSLTSAPIYLSTTGFYGGGRTQTTTKRYPVEVYALHLRYILGKQQGLSDADSVNNTGPYADTTIVGGATKLR